MPLPSRFLKLLCLSAPLLAFVHAGSALAAEQTALTQDGKMVILEDSGRWRYADGSEPEKTPGLQLNPRKFQRSAAQVFQVKSTRNKSALWIDPGKWTFKRGDGSQEFRFEHKGTAAFAGLVTESLQLSLELMLDAGLENARKVSPDIKVTERELREVNGLQVGMQVLKGTMKGQGVVFLSYCYSDASGSTQAVTWTVSNAFAQQRAEMELWLNGLVVQP